MKLEAKNVITTARGKERGPQRGFTLLETSIVLIIIGLMLIPLLKLYDIHQEKERIAKTKENLKVIEQALQDYANKPENSGRLPCPASLTASSDTPAFGAATACSTGAAPAGTFVVAGARAAGGAQQVLIGAIPFRALNIAAEETLDGWGRRLVYAVTRDLTNPDRDPEAVQGQIALIDENGASMVTPAGSALYALISFGDQGMGAYSSAGGVQAQTCRTGMLESENCDFADATFRQLTFNQNFVDQRNFALGNRYFDDFIRAQTSIKVEDGNDDLPVYVPPHTSYHRYPRNNSYIPFETCPQGYSWVRLPATSNPYYSGNPGGWHPLASGGYQPVFVKNMTPDAILNVATRAPNRHGTLETSFPFPSDGSVLPLQMQVLSHLHNTVDRAIGCYRDDFDVTKFYPGATKIAARFKWTYVPPVPEEGPRTDQNHDSHTGP